MINHQEQYDFLRSVGGVPISHAKQGPTSDPDIVDVWNFGLLMDYGPAGLVHTQESLSRRDAIINAMPRFQVSGRLSDDPKKIILWDVFKNPVVKKAMEPFLKKIGNTSGIYPGTHQFSGSCVGVGSGDNITIAAAVEVAYKGDPELPVTFFWPYHYARGRYRGGMRTPGEGSMSESQAEALLEDGTYRADVDGIPQLADRGDGLVLSGASQEIQWSDGDASNIMALLEKGRVNRFRTSSVIKSLDDARACIRDAKMPFMFCGMWGGLMTCPVVGTPPVLLNREATQWSHNQTCIAWWDHPELGELFAIKNQWGNTVHGQDPAGLPPGAYWIKAADAQKQIRQGSCIVVSAFDGFPALDMTFDWTA